MLTLFAYGIFSGKHLDFNFNQMSGICLLLLKGVFFIWWMCGACDVFHFEPGGGVSSITLSWWFTEFLLSDLEMSSLPCFWGMFFWNCRISWGGRSVCAGFVVMIMCACLMIPDFYHLYIKASGYYVWLLDFTLYCCSFGARFLYQFTWFLTSFIGLFVIYL